MQLEAREKRTLIFGSVVIVLLLAYLLWPSGNMSPKSSVELVSGGQRGTVPPPAPVAPLPAPAPNTVPTVAAPPPPTAPVASLPGGMPQGVALTGIAGGGAIFSLPDGSQHYIPQGREIAPGVVLQAVRLREVMIAVGTTNYRLGFGGMPIAVTPSPSPAIAQPSVVSSLSPDAAPANDVRAINAQIQAGLSPRMIDGRISGYYIRAVSPVMQSAGVQPGDLILAVNGSELGPQSFPAIAAAVQRGGPVVLDVERNGQRLRLAATPGR